MHIPGFRRNERRPALKALLAAAVAAALLGFAVVGFGLVDVAADKPHSWLTYNLLHFAFKQSVGLRASGITVPDDLASPSRIQLGAQHFHLVCANCHGGPGIGQSPIALSMRPQPQSLPAVVGQFSDEELFWIVKHGVKFSAMPSWTNQTRDDEVWSMVSFIRQLPKMSAEAYLAEIAPGAAVAGSPKLPLQAPIVLHDADTRRNTQGKDEFLFKTPAIGFGDQGAAIDPVEMCGRCHGGDATGSATGGEAPNLTLQDPAYIRAALKAYATGQRRSGFMQPVAAQLSDAQIDALADYYGGMAHVASKVTVADAEVLARGRTIANDGLSKAALPACTNCHMGAASKAIHAPALGGQSDVFLRRQLAAMRDGDRGTTGGWNPMPGVAHVLSDADIAAVAAYYATQPVADADASLPASDHQVVQGDLVAGEKLFSTVCVTCHTRQATGDPQGDFPNLTIQTPAYIRQSLMQYRAGVRPSVKMKLAVGAMDDATIASLATYVGGLAPHASQGAIDADAVARGGVIAHDGIAARGVPGCLSCHNPELTAALPLVARLQGQNAHYLDWKLDELSHLGPDQYNPLNPMPAIANQLTRQEQKDLAAFFGAEPPLAKPAP